MGVRIAEDRRPGKIIVDWEEPSGRRRWKTFQKTQDGRRQARIFAGDLERKLARGEPLPNERITFGEVAKQWLIHVRATVEPQTATNYEIGLRKHLLPEFEDRPIARVTRGVFKAHVERLLADKRLKAGTVGTKVVGVARNMFAWAMEPEQGYVVANPAAKLGRVLKLKSKRDVVRAMTREQLASFLGAARRTLNEDEYLHILLMVRSGLRLAEAEGLQWGDFLDDDRPVLCVERQALKGGGLGPPKTKQGRRKVDVSADLREALRGTWVRRHEERLRHGLPMTGWILCPEFSEVPKPGEAERSRQRMARAMRRALAAAGLPHFRPHDLRHTFCTLLLSQGEPVQWVKEQAGHSSISETVDTYGSWIQSESPGAVDRMADKTKASTEAKVVEFLSAGIVSSASEKA